MPLRLRIPRRTPGGRSLLLVCAALLTASCRLGAPSGPDEGAAPGAGTAGETGYPPPAGPTTRIYVDGHFGDWTAIEPVHEDAAGDAAGSEVDWTRLQLARDGRFLFLRVALTRVVNLQEENGLRLHVDADGDSATGEAVRGVGAELTWSFGKRRGTLRRDGSARLLTHAELGLFSAPTVRARGFEIALDRRARIEGEPLFTADTIRVVLESGEGGDWLPDRPGGALAALPDGGGPTPPKVPPLERSEGTVRFLSFNVARDGLFDPERTGAHGRILTALAPEIVGLQEIYDHGAAATRRRILELSGRASQPGWHAAKVGRDLVVVARYPITETFAIEGYEEYRSGGFLLDTGGPFSAPTLLVLTHPPCCTGGTPSADERRQDVVDGIVAFLRDARTDGGRLDLPAGSPIVVMGDMNFVGDARQPRTLRTGAIAQTGRFGAQIRPDWDGSDLLDLAPPTTGLPASFTWYDPESDYPPGRLDYLLVTDSAVEVARKFVLFTPALPSGVLDEYGLRGEDALTASDHLPVVADLRAR